MSATSQATMNQIALIGVTQSGKTTLAAGLAKCSDKNFAVGFADDTTREYLGGVISRIDGGNWPAGSGGENIDLAITLNLKGGHSTAVTFKEYKGEKFSDPTYVQKIVGAPNGALILLNPGMDILQSASGRSKMLVNMKRIIDHLKSVSCTAIALVVTAHDRLSTDLAEFKPQFDEYLSEVENYLCTKTILWKRFEVTITGPLADQKAPVFAKGAENTARAPFVWLMVRIEAKRRRTKLIKLLKGCALVAAILAVVTALGIGWKFWQEWKMLDAQESQASSCINEFDNAYKISVKLEDGMKKATDNLRGVISSLKADQYWFHPIDSRRERIVKEMQLKYDDLRCRYLQTKIANHDGKNDGLTEAECKAVDNLIKEFNPTNTLLKSALTNSWAKVRPNARRRYDIRHEHDLNVKVCDAKDRNILKKIRNDIEDWEASPDFVPEKTKLLEHVDERTDELNGQEHDKAINDQDSAKKHDRQGIRDIEDSINIWAPRTECGNKIKEGIVNTFRDKSKVWYQEITDRECNDVADSVCGTLKSLGCDDSITIRTELEEVMKFVRGHTNASPSVRRDASDRVCRAQAAFLERFAEKYTSRWMPNAPKRPALSEQNEKFIIEALDVVDITNRKEKLSDRFLLDLKQERKDAELTWSSEQQRICEQFVKENLIKGRSEKELFEDYAEWYAKWYRGDSPDSPHVENVNRRVELVVSDFFDRYIEKVRKPSFIEGCKGLNSIGERRNARKEFDNFSDLCMKINSKKRGNLSGIANSWCADFASACYNAGLKHKNISTAFQQVLTITQVEVMVSEDSVYNDYKGAKFGLWLTGYDWKNEEFNEVVHEDWLKGEWCSDYVATTKNVYHTIWSNPKKIYVNPWTCFTLNFWGTVSDGSGTDAVKPDEVEAIIRLRPMDNTERAEHVLNYSFKCKKREKSYTCSCKIHCTFEGPYLFGLYEKCRNGGVVK